MVNLTLLSPTILDPKEASDTPREEREKECCTAAHSTETQGMPDKAHVTLGQLHFHTSFKITPISGRDSF